MKRLSPLAFAVTVAVDVAIVAGLAGCPTTPAPEPDEPPTTENPAVAAARANFPRVIDMHQRIVARSCAPNTGVCHNTSNFPELSTTGALLQTVGAFCNLEIPDPTSGFDLCEQPAHHLVTAGFVARIAWSERVGLAEWRFGLDAAPDVTAVRAVRFTGPERTDPVFSPAEEWGVEVQLTAGVPEALVTTAVDEPFFTEPYIDDNLASLVAGDTNRNGIFGADETPTDGRAKVIEPGDLQRSYLWGRLTGTVPGTRMPLANQALDDAEYIAVACFIEGLAAGPDALRDDAPIDYDACAFAAEPISYASR